MKLVFLSHTPANGTFRVGSHHLSREMSRRGHDVVHISSAVSLAHLLRLRSSAGKLAVRNAWNGSWRDSDDVLNVVPRVLIPPSWVLGSLPGKLQSRLSLAAVARHVREALSSSEVALVDQPLMADFLVPLNARTVIYRPTDQHPSGSTAQGERLVLAQTDAVVATSPGVLAGLPLQRMKTSRSLVLENGVESERFAGGTSQAGEGFVYIGALDARFDWQAVADLAAAVPSTVISLAGPITVPPPIALPANVKLLGTVEYSHVPRLLYQSAVGLLPFSTHPGNDARSPMKYYEYLAAGLFVVAAGTGELRRRSNSGVFTYAPSSVQSREVVAAGIAALAAGQKKRNIEGQMEASAFSWTARAAQLEEFLTRVVDGDSSAKDG